MQLRDKRIHEGVALMTILVGLSIIYVTAFCS